MAYANAKGATGEREFAEFLTLKSKPFGHKYVRIGNTERGKKFLHGDVVLDPRSDPKKTAFLSDYFLESKFMAHPNVFEIIQEHEVKAREYGKTGVIAYIIKQEKGSKRDGTIIAMTPETFGRLIQDLQGYKEAVDN
jgi:hypothetical protein